MVLYNLHHRRVGSHPRLWLLLSPAREKKILWGPPYRGRVFTTPVCDKEYVITNAFFLYASVIRIMTGSYIPCLCESSSRTWIGCILYVSMVKVFFLELSMIKVKSRLQWTPWRINEYKPCGALQHASTCEQRAGAPPSHQLLAACWWLKRSRI